MSQENVEIVRRATSALPRPETSSRIDHAPDFVWDMSKFRGWPEQQTYEGMEGARAFMRDWLEAGMIGSSRWRRSTTQATRS